MSRILWSQIDGHYRGQSNAGVILTVDQDAMNMAIKNAGNAVFDTEWWVETLSVVLEHWGLKSKRTLDHTTQMPHVHYRLTTDGIPAGNTDFLNGANGAGPLKGTGPLTTRLLISGKLNSSNLDSGKLNSGRLTSDKLNSGKLPEHDR